MIELQDETLDNMIQALPILFMNVHNNHEL